MPLLAQRVQSVRSATMQSPTAGLRRSLETDAGLAALVTETDTSAGRSTSLTGLPVCALFLQDFAPIEGPNTGVCVW